MVAAAVAVLLAVAYQPPRTAQPRASTRAASALAITCERPLLCEAVSLRAACREELDGVARLQLDVFLPSTPTPACVPLLSGMCEANHRSVRAGMRRRLSIDIAARVSKGSDILVAAVPADGVAPLHTDSAYAEADVRLLGTVDISSQELELPTHPLSEGLYLSHMAVDPEFRRRGVGRRLLEAAVAAARARAAGGGIYLHVERTNAGARSLYEQCGFVRLHPPSAPTLCTHPLHPPSASTSLHPSFCTPPCPQVRTARALLRAHPTSTAHPPPPLTHLHRPPPPPPSPPPTATLYGRCAKPTRRRTSLSRARLTCSTATCAIHRYAHLHAA